MTGDAAPFCQRERATLCDLLSELGPDAPTLCQGWRSADLAAHLLTRDRRPDAMPGMVLSLPPFKAWSTRVLQGARDTQTWDALVSRVRSGPPPLTRPFDRAVNTIEYFVHHEDLRRAQPGWAPRELAAPDEAQIWARLRLMRFAARSAAGRLEAPGREPLVLSKKGGATVKGPPGELALWLLGRTTVARVETMA